MRPAPGGVRLRIAAACLALAAAACSGRGVRTVDGIAEPWQDDFFEFPAKYRGRVVRLDGVEARRVGPTRPLVFASAGEPRRDVTVSDGRGLSRSQRLEPGARVTIVIECTEGRTDRGNLLLAIGPAAPGTDPAPGSVDVP